MKDRLVGWFLDGVIWFSVASLILVISGFAVKIIEGFQAV